MDSHSLDNHSITSSTGDSCDLVSRVALARHSTRRRQGVPTVSVLVGPFGSSVSAWQSHLSLTGQRSISSYGDWTNLPGSSAIDLNWLRDIEFHWQLEAVVATAWQVACGNSTGIPLGDLRSKSSWEVELLLENSLPDDPAPSAAWLCRVLAPRLTDDMLARHWTSSSRNGNHVFRRMLVRALTQVLPPTAISGLLLFCQLPEREHEWFEAGVCESVRWAIDAPNLPLALRVSPPVWENFAQRHRHDRIASMLREGVVSLNGLASDKGTLIAPTLDHKTSSEVRHPTILEVFGRDGGSSESLELYRQLIEATERSLESPEASDRARSAAERFLFDRLENHPLFAGQFELNGRVEASAKLDQSWEIDLLAKRRRLAVEIDGYYHFQNSEAYRRDRRKDCALQLAGFVVLRFLAEDVVQSLEDILRTIERAFRALLQDRDDS